MVGTDTDVSSANAGQAAGPPKLGVVYEPDSIPVLSLVAAVKGRWGLVWILPEGLDEEQTAVQLRRFGECVDLSAAAADDRIATLRERGVSGVTTFADGQLSYASQLAIQLGAPANPPEVTQRLTDKLAQRTALSAAGLPTPPFCRVDPALTEPALMRAMDGIPYPVVIKPAVGSGGRFTNSVDSFPALSAELNRRWSAGDHRTLIVEQCLGPFPPRAIDGYGDYGSVEIVVAAGELQILGVSGRMPLATPFRETGSFAPNHWTAHETAAVCDAATRAVRALGVRVGCLHVELKLTSDGPRVIEVNGRVPGGGIPDMLLAATGDNLYAAAAAAAMGEPVRRVGRQSDLVHYALALQPPVGQPSRLVADWRARLDAISGVRHVNVRAESTTAGPQDGSYSYLLLISGAAASHDELRALQTELATLIEPENA